MLESPNILSPVLVQGAVRIADRDPRFHPGHWIRDIYEEHPTNAAPLAILLNAQEAAPDGAISTMKTPSVYFSWPLQPFNPMNGPIMGVYTTSPSGASPTPYAGGAAAKTRLYFQVAPAFALAFVPDATFGVANKTTMGRNSVIVRAVNVAGPTTSYLLAELDAADTTNDLANGQDLWYTQGSLASKEITELQTGMYEEATRWHNISQHRTEAGELSDAEILEYERVDPNIRARLMKQVLDRFLRAWDATLSVTGQRAEPSGKDGQTRTRSVYNWIKFGNQDTPLDTPQIFNFVTDPKYKGMSPLRGTLPFLKDIDQLVTLMSDAPHKTAITSGKVISMIRDCIDDKTSYVVDGTEMIYGVQYNQLRGLRKPWRLMESTTFSTNPSLENSMLVTEIPLLRQMNFMPLEFIPPQNKTNSNGTTWMSGEKAGWRAHDGLKFDGLPNHAWIDGLGLKNTYSG